MVTPESLCELQLVDVIETPTITIGVVRHTGASHPGWFAFRIHEIVLVLDTGSATCNLHMAEWLLGCNLDTTDVEFSGSFSA